MDASIIRDLIAKSQPFWIETASGRTFEVPHRDFIHFSPKHSAKYLFFEEDGEDRFPAAPFLTVTAAVTKAWPD